MQKSAAVLGLENVLSDCSTNLPPTSLVNSFSSLVLFSIQLSYGPESFALSLPFNTVNPDPSYNPLASQPRPFV